MNPGSILRKGTAAITAALALVWLMTACQSTEPVIVPSDVAIIRLTGNALGATLVIDHRLSFQVSAENTAMTFKVRPGEHRVRVERAGAIVLERTVSLAKDETLDLAVP